MHALPVVSLLPTTNELSISDLPPPVLAPPRREPLTAGCVAARGRPERSSPAVPTGSAARGQPSPAAAPPAAAHVNAVMHYAHNLSAAPPPSAGNDNSSSPRLSGTGTAPRNVADPTPDSWEDAADATTAGTVATSHSGRPSAPGAQPNPAASGGNAPPHPRRPAPRAPARCQKAGCNRPVWVDHITAKQPRTYDYCGRGHADADGAMPYGLLSRSHGRSAPGPCTWQHCLQLCHRRAAGGYYDFCSRRHARLAGALGPSATSAPAQRHTARPSQAAPSPPPPTNVLAFYEGELPSKAPTLIALSNHYVHATPFRCSWGADGYNMGHSAEVFKSQGRSVLLPSTLLNGQGILPFLNFDVWSAEQAIMIGKACLFGDSTALSQLLSSQGSDPTFCKQVGRTVRNFVPSIWEQLRGDLAFSVLCQKFDSHSSLAQTLLDTGDALLVEAAERDLVWGVGLKLGDPRALDPQQWPLGAQNLLGRTLVRVRTYQATPMTAAATGSLANDLGEEPEPEAPVGVHDGLPACRQVSASDLLELASKANNTQGAATLLQAPVCRANDAQGPASPGQAPEIRANNTQLPTGARDSSARDLHTAAERPTAWAASDSYLQRPPGICDPHLVSDLRAGLRAAAAASWRWTELSAQLRSLSQLAAAALQAHPEIVEALQSYGFGQGGYANRFRYQLTADNMRALSSELAAYYILRTDAPGARGGNRREHDDAPPKQQPPAGSHVRAPGDENARPLLPAPSSLAFPTPRAIAPGLSGWFMQQSGSHPSAPHPQSSAEFRTWPAPALRSTDPNTIRPVTGRKPASLTFSFTDTRRIKSAGESRAALPRRWLVPSRISQRHGSGATAPPCPMQLWPRPEGLSASRAAAELPPLVVTTRSCNCSCACSATATTSCRCVCFGYARTLLSCRHEYPELYVWNRSKIGPWQRASGSAQLGAAHSSPDGANDLNLGPKMGGGCQLKYSDSPTGEAAHRTTFREHTRSTWPRAGQYRTSFLGRARASGVSAFMAKHAVATPGQQDRNRALALSKRLPARFRTLFHDWLTLTGIDVASAWDQALQGHSFDTFRSAVATAASYGQPDLWRIFRTPAPPRGVGNERSAGAPTGAGNFLHHLALDRALRAVALTPCDDPSPTMRARLRAFRWSIGPGVPNWPAADAASDARAAALHSTWPNGPVRGRASAAQEDDAADNLSGCAPRAGSELTITTPLGESTPRPRAGAPSSFHRPAGHGHALEDVLANTRFSMTSVTFQPPPGRTAISSVSARAWASSHNPSKQWDITEALPAWSSASAHAFHTSDAERRRSLPWPLPLFRWIADCFDGCASETVRKHMANSIQAILFCTPVRERWATIDWSSAPLPYGLLSWDAPLARGIEGAASALDPRCDAQHRTTMPRRVTWGALHTRILETRRDMRPVPLSPGNMPNQPSRLRHVVSPSPRRRLALEPSRHAPRRDTAASSSSSPDDSQDVPVDQLGGSLVAECARLRLPVPTYGASSSSAPWHAPTDFQDWNSRVLSHFRNGVTHRPGSPRHSSHSAAEITRFGPTYNSLGLPLQPGEAPNLHASDTTRWSSATPQERWVSQPPPPTPIVPWAEAPWNTPAHWAPRVSPDAAAFEASSRAAASDTTACLRQLTGPRASDDSVRQLLTAFGAAHSAGSASTSWPAFLRWYFGPGFMVTRLHSAASWTTPALIAVIHVHAGASLSTPSGASCLLAAPHRFDTPRQPCEAPTWVARTFHTLHDSHSVVWGVYNVDLLSEYLLHQTTAGRESLHRVPRAPAPEIMSVAAATQTALLAFSSARRLVNATGRWFSRDVFYDDFLSHYYEVFANRVAASESDLADEIGVDMADGKPYYPSGTPGKNKHEVATQRQSLTMLGLEVGLNGLGTLTFGDAKRTKVSRRGLLILADSHRNRRIEIDRCTAADRSPRHLQPRTSGSELRSWAGQVSDLGNACPSIAITLSNLYAVLPPGYGDNEALVLSHETQEHMMDVVLAIRSSRGRAAMPTTSIPDAADGNTWVTFCDSARKLVKSVDGNAWTVGAGGWLMNLATRVVIRFSFGWRKTELDLLCISTLEAKCQEIALFIVSVIAPAQPNVVVWCLQYGDNLAESQHVLNTFKGVAAVSRVIASRRSALIMARPDLAVKSSHVRRHQNSESDALADNEERRADDLIRLRIAAAGSGVHITEFTAKEIPQVVRNTSDLIDAVRRADHNVWAAGMRTRATDFFEAEASTPTSSAGYMAGFVNYISALVTAREKLTVRFKVAMSSWPLLHHNLPSAAALTDSDRRRCGFAAEVTWDLSMAGSKWRAPSFRPMPLIDRDAGAEPFLTDRAMPKIRRNNPILCIAASPVEAMQAPDAGRVTLPRTGPTNKSFGAFVDYIGVYLRKLDDKLAAQRDVAIRACGGPPRPRPPFRFPPPPGAHENAAAAVRYINTLREYFLQRFRDYAADAIQACSDAPRPMTTRRLFPFPEDLDIVDAWLLAYDAEWQRCDSVDDVFDISSLPSNGVIDHGVVIRDRHLDCHGLSWDTGAAYAAGSNVLRRDFPILPVTWADPQLFTELKLGTILAKVALSTFLGDPFPDIDILLEHVFLGFDVRTTVESCVILSANTKGFFENRAFVNAKTTEKMEKFATPRLSPGVRGLAIVPCFLLSNNVVLDQVAEDTGKIKPRLTCNPSGPFPSNRRHRGQPETTWEDLGFDLTINGNHTRPVPFDYLKLTDVAHNAAVFLAGQNTLLEQHQDPSVLAVGQQKSDMASFYECLARGPCWWRFNANYVTSRGMQLNSRCCFGFSAEPDTANRWSSIICTMMNNELTMEQAAWERLYCFQQDGAP